MVDWPTEKKQSFVAAHITTALARIGIKKIIDDPGSLSKYLTTIDETAEQHPDDPRMAVFVRNFIEGMIAAAVGEFEKQNTK